MPCTLREKLAAFDPELPLERAHTIPNTWYFDPDTPAAEKGAVCGTPWQPAGGPAQLAGPGAFFPADVAGEPILVVRAEDGVVRAFFNVCRHRAAQVINEPQGRAAKLRCRY